MASKTNCKQGYENQRDNILGVYESIKKKNLFSTLDKDQSSTILAHIEEKEKSLRANKFIVSVSGQIKSGKSTLINALIFNDNILPVDDTPHTAKITLIEYGEKRGFKIIFYSEKEWESLKQSEVDGKNYFTQYIEPDVNICIENGIFEAEVIRSEAFIKWEKDLCKLDDYVARGGKYTPFVNQVKIVIDNKDFKELEIVDTPGINDPNPMRSKTTTDWISKADANIYVTYAKRALDKSDMDFIDQYLLGIPSKQRLTVVNKIDLVENQQELDAWIKEVSQNPEFINRKIFSKDSVTVCVSSLAALIDKMSTKGTPLSKDLEYYAEQMDDKGFLEPETHNFKTLVDKIYSVLVKSKGQGLLDSHRKFIINLYDQGLDSIEKKIAQNKQSLENEVKSRGELEKEAKIVKEKRKTYDDYIQDICNDELPHISSDFRDTLSDKLMPKKKEIGNEVFDQLKKIRDIDYFKSNVPWIIKDAMVSISIEMLIIINDVGEKSSKKIKDVFEKLKERIQNDNILSDRLITQLFKMIYTTNLIPSFKKNIDDNFTENRINTLVKDNTFFYQRWFNTPGGLEKVQTALKYEIDDFIHRSFDQQIIAPIELEVDGNIKKIASQFEAELKEEMEKLSKELKTIVDNYDQRKERIQLLELDNEKLENEKNIVTKEKDEIIAELNKESKI